MVELEGIEVKLETSYASNPKRKHQKRPMADRSRSTQSLVHDPGGLPASSSLNMGNHETSDEEDPEQLPFTVDLAQSFLQEEGQREKEKLKAAIVQSRQPDGSSMLNEINDDESVYGVGNALSLPSFLADFLKGVGDRIQLKVKKLVVDLDLKLELTSENPSFNIGDGADVVTIRLSIDHVDLLGVMPIQQASDRTRNPRDLGIELSDKEPLQATRETRHVVFGDIEVLLVSDASLFANLSRFDVPPSPTATQTSSAGKSGSKLHATASSSSRSDLSPIPDVVELSGVIERGGSIRMSPRSEVSSIISDGRRFADPEGEEEATEKLGSQRAASTRYNEYEDSASDHLYDTRDGAREDAREDDDKFFGVDNDNSDFFVHQQSPAQGQSTSSYHQNYEERDQSGLSHSGYIEDSINEFSSQQISPQSLVSSQYQDSRLVDSSVDENARPFPSDFETHPGQENSGSISSTPDDLTQSKIFSHEEAESMYMSAISHNPLDETAAESEIPGRWDDSSSEVESPTPSPNPSEGCATVPNRDSPLPKTSITNEEPHLSDSPTWMKHSERSPTPTSDLAYMRYQHREMSDTKEKSNLRLSDPENSSSPNPEDSSSPMLQNPLVIMKKIMSIDSVHVELPAAASLSAKSGLPGPTQGFSNRNADSSIAPKGFRDLDLPGNVIDGRDTVRTDHREAEGLPSETFHPNNPSEISSQPISVEVGQLELLGDIGLTKLTILVIQQNMALLENESAETQNRDISRPSPFSLRLRIADISWQFLDSVRGFSGTDGGSEYPSPEPRSFTAAPEILLKASFKNLDFTFNKHESTRNSKLSIGKVSFGYVSETILSFDSELKMRESTGDILAPVGNDVVLTIIQTSKTTKINLTTLPLRFVLDLRRLDETFGWFGGFSSILGLGSSMMSTVTVVSAKPATSHSLKRPRAVHFEQPVSERPAASENPVHAQKFTARLGGLAVVLQGANSTFRLDGTALKAVSRLEGAGLQIDKLRFTGPYVGHDNDECAVNIHLANIRLEYMSMPKEVDLTRLLSLLSPSRDKYGQDDDILLDTLLHQRRQAGVIRITIEDIHGNISKPSHLRFFLDIAEELKKLSTVAKYLPEDDRPGILTFCLIRELSYVVTINENFGSLTLSSQSMELAHVTLPGLTALGIKSLQVQRNSDEALIRDAPPVRPDDEMSLPRIMARFIGNEMEPVIKVKIQNLLFEYHVSTLMAVMNLSSDGSPEFMVADMISSIATLKGQQQKSDSSPPSLSQSSSRSDKYAISSRPMRLDIAITDSIVGLNPLNCPSRGLIVLTNAHLNGITPKVDEAQATLEIKRASILIIDDKSNINLESERPRPISQDNQGDQIQHLINLGFVSVSYISSAKASMRLVKSQSSESQLLDVEIRDDLFVLESCADSTQTLQMILNGLKPPTPQNTKLKYRTEIVPVEDMLASLSGDAFTTSTSNEGDASNIPLGLDEGDMMDDEVPQNLEYVSSFYNPNPEGLHEGIAESMLDNDLESLASPPATRKIGDKRLLESFQEQYQIAPGNAPLDFQDDHFGASSTVGGTAHRWDTKQNTYRLNNDFPIRESPLKLRVRDVHIIWNLFDGYDWPHTRDIITKAVTDIESKAAERHSIRDKRKSIDLEEEGSEIGDFLFNSIYIGVPANRDPKDLARQVNRNIDDGASETESYAPSSISSSPNRQNQIPRGKGKKLRLTRSKYHKMTFELKGLSADLVVFPPGAEETQSCIDIRVQDLDIFDHVPTSTWKKFATYMHDAGERESGTSMIHLEILNVKPVPTLAASEIILKVCNSLEGQFFQN